MKAFTCHLSSTLFLYMLQVFLAFIFSVGTCSAGTKDNSHLRTIGIVSKESRVTFEKYAKSTKQPVSNVYRDFATRKLICGDIYGSANLIVSSDLLITAAHILYDERCKLKAEAAKCFLRDLNGEKIKIDVSSIRSGLDGVPHCTLPAHKFRAEDIARSRPNDWVIVRLKKEVRNVIPYGLAVVSGNYAPMSLIAIQAGANNFGKQSSPPSSIQNCRWRNTFHLEGAFAMQIDCDVGPGASGGALLNNNHAIVGLQSAFGKTTNGTDYNMYTSYNLGTPITSAIRAALELARASSASSTPLD